MAHNVQDVSMHAGDTRVVRVTVTDGGSVVDLTGAMVSWWLMRAPGATPVLTKTTASGIAISNAAGGVFDVNLDPADTASLAGLYYHEGEITESGGAVSTVVTGDFIVGPTA